MSAGNAERRAKQSYGSDITKSIVRGVVAGEHRKRPENKGRFEVQLKVTGCSNTIKCVLQDQFMKPGPIQPRFFNRVFGSVHMSVLLVCPRSGADPSGLLGAGLPGFGRAGMFKGSSTSRFWTYWHPKGTGYRC